GGTVPRFGGSAVRGGEGGRGPGAGASPARAWGQGPPGCPHAAGARRTRSGRGGGEGRVVLLRGKRPPPGPRHRRHHLAGTGERRAVPRARASLSLPG